MNDDMPVRLNVACKHFWRRRQPIPITGPIAYGEVGEDGNPRYVRLPDLVMVCRKCAGQITKADLVPMTEDELARYLGSDRQP